MRYPPTPFPWHTGGTFNPDSNDPRTSIWGPTDPGMQSGNCVATQIRPADAALILEKVSGNPCSWCGALHLACQSHWYEQKKCCPDCTHRERVPAPDWVVLLLECRDALPAITRDAARVHGIDLTLADRIDEILKPWRVADADWGSVTPLRRPANETSEPPIKRHSRDCACLSCHYSKKHPQVKPHHATCGCFECASVQASTETPDVRTELVNRLIDCLEYRDDLAHVQVKEGKGAHFWETMYALKRTGRAALKAPVPPNAVGQFLRQLNDDAEARADIQAEGDPEKADDAPDCPEPCCTIDKPLPVKPATLERDPNDAFRWICPKCTTANAREDVICLGGCGTMRPERQDTT